MVGMGADSPPASHGSVRMVNKALRRLRIFPDARYSRRAGSWWRAGEAAREGWSVRFGSAVRVRSRARLVLKGCGDGLTAAWASSGLLDLCMAWR